MPVTKEELIARVISEIMEGRHVLTRVVGTGSNEHVEVLDFFYKIRDEIFSCKTEITKGRKCRQLCNTLWKCDNLSNVISIQLLMDCTNFRVKEF